MMTEDWRRSSFLCIDNWTHNGTTQATGNRWQAVMSQFNFDPTLPLTLHPWPYFNIWHKMAMANTNIPFNLYIFTPRAHWRRGDWFVYHVYVWCEQWSYLRSTLRQTTTTVQRDNHSINTARPHGLNNTMQWPMKTTVIIVYPVNTVHKYTSMLFMQYNFSPRLH